MQAIDRILQYLKAMPGRGLLFKKGGSLSIEIYTDADYTGSLVDKRMKIRLLHIFGRKLGDLEK